ncbi:hypothetical protein B0T19DRAFT_412745 [Cercophora scortea]|uniref:Uncharacterized protein n=1 Tax=Cercophora scortea TaxID=314031 RepID=A0AAE0J5U3_9PEZI|nr:hypothetical protein B0T19DRAFT_412745 [Cercophora scortea]
MFGISFLVLFHSSLFFPVIYISFLCLFVLAVLFHLTGFLAASGFRITDGLIFRSQSVSSWGWLVLLSAYIGLFWYVLSFQDFSSFLQARHCLVSFGCIWRWMGMMMDDAKLLFLSYMCTHLYAYTYGCLYLITRHTVGWVKGGSRWITHSVRKRRFAAVQSAMLTNARNFFTLHT